MNQQLVVKKSTYLQISLWLIGIISVLCIFVGVIFFITTTTHTSLTQEITELDKKVQSLLTKEVVAMELSQKIVQTVSNNRILWSEILVELFRSMPMNVSITSFSTNSSKKITLQLATTDFQYISSTLDSLGRSELFKNTFIPSLSVSAAIDNGKIITFPLSIDLSRTTSATKNQPSPL